RTTDVVGIVALEIRRAHAVASQDTIAKAGCEALDLPLDGGRAIDVRTSRNVTVRIPGVFAGGGARGVELTLLHHEHEGPFRMLATPHGGLAGGDLVERAAEVNGGCLPAARVAPGNRSVESPVDLECAGAIAITAQTAHVAPRQERPTHGGELRRTRVEQHHA